MQKRKKYRNVAVDLDGISFDSKAERNYYAKLKLREKAGEVSDIQTQVRFQIIPQLPPFIGETRVNRAIFYVADFVFMENGRQRIVDVKASKFLQTKDFIIKRRLMKHVLGLDVEVVYSS